MEAVFSVRVVGWLMGSGKGIPRQCFVKIRPRFHFSPARFQKEEAPAATFFFPARRRGGRVAHNKRPGKDPARLKVTTKSKPAYEKA
ncbi:hypothetical protein DCC81_02740 [Chitinophaga parva]|uniref:Uncharacterized protein n=1 Tax=Chitinophaga parva TaxID=2169414 RepID=A0A2T7BL96_9BACT|nr:hypothetical protein DCC81_02740 [Chitinophaga parva]